jgi:hypothetical protein
MDSGSLSEFPLQNFRGRSRIILWIRVMRRGDWRLFRCIIRGGIPAAVVLGAIIRQLRLIPVFFRHPECPAALCPVPPWIRAWRWRSGLRRIS